MACLCMLGRTPRPVVTSAVTAPPPHDHTNHGHGHTHIHSYSPPISYQFTFSPLVSSSKSQSQSIQEEESRVVSRRREIQHVLQGFVTFSTGSIFLSASYGNDGRWTGIYPSSMDHVTSNDKRGSSEKTGRLLQF